MLWEVPAGKGAQKRGNHPFSDHDTRFLCIYIIAMQDFELGSSVIPLSRLMAAKGLECGFLALFCACGTEYL